MNKISIVCISVYLILAAFLQLPDMNLYDSKRILQLGLFTVIGVTIFINFFQKQKFYTNNPLRNQNFIFSKKIAALILLLGITGFISVLFSIQSGHAALEFLFFFLLLTLIYLISPGRLREHYFLGQAIFITALLYSNIYLIIFFGNYISSYLDPMIIMWPEKLSYTIAYEGIELKGREVLYFVNKRFFNQTQTWTIPVLTGLFLFIFQKRPKDRFLHLLLFLLISFWWMLVFASGGRGTTVSLIASIMVIAILYRKDVFRFIKAWGFTFITGGIFYFLFFRLFSSDGLPMMRSTENYNMRLETWEHALDLWIQNPIFGIGPYYLASMQYMIDGSPWSAHPHNFYIQFLTEWGLIAFLAMSVLLFLAGRIVYNNYTKIGRNSPNRIIYIAVTWSMAAALMHAFISGVMVTPMSQIWFVLIGAWLLGYAKRDLTLENSTSQISYLNYVYVLLLCIILFVIYEDLLTLQSLYTEYMTNYPGDQFFPRFWGQGLFE